MRTVRQKTIQKIQEVSENGRKFQDGRSALYGEEAAFRDGEVITDAQKYFTISGAGDNVLEDFDVTAGEIGVRGVGANGSRIVRCTRHSRALPLCRLCGTARLSPLALRVIPAVRHGGCGRTCYVRSIRRWHCAAHEPCGRATFQLA